MVVVAGWGYLSSPSTVQTAKPPWAALGSIESLHVGVTSLKFNLFRGSQIPINHSCWKIQPTTDRWEPTLKLIQSCVVCCPHPLYLWRVTYPQGYHLNYAKTAKIDSPKQETNKKNRSDELQTRVSAHVAWILNYHTKAHQLKGPSKIATIKHFTVFFFDWEKNILVAQYKEFFLVNFF